MKLNKALFFTAIGVLFEKVFPLLISFVFINKIQDAQYGLWILYFQFFLIFSASISTPLNLFFNINFFNNSFKNIYIVELRLILILLFIGTIILLLSGITYLHTLLLLVMICSSVFNALLFNYLRFSEKNLKYALSSGIRFFLFLFCLISFTTNNELEISEILLSFILVNFLPFLGYFKKIKIKFKSSDFKIEFLKLAFYGIATFFLSGIDRAVLGYYGYDLVDIATIGYAATIANVPSILTEVLKKYLSPRFFKDFSFQEFYSKSTIKLSANYFIFLTIAQLVLPMCFFFFLKQTSFIKESLVTDNFFSLILVFSVSFAVYNLYHFLNPIIFFKNKSHSLILILLACSLLFLFLLKLNITFIDPFLKITIAKLIVTITLIIFTFRMVLYERK